MSKYIYDKSQHYTSVTPTLIFPAVSFGNFRVGISVWQLLLGEPSLGNFRLGTSAWQLSLGNLRLGTFAGELSLGNARL